MAAHELHLILVTNKKRVSGKLTLGISRLPVMYLVKHLAKGWNVKDLKNMYPHIDHDEWVAINQLYKDLKFYNIIA